MLYIMSVLQTAKSSVTMVHTVYALKWGYEIRGIVFNFSPLVKRILEASKCMPGRKVQQKDPITIKHLQDMVKKYISKKCLLNYLRDVVLCILCFCGFLRFSELVSLTSADVEFKDSYFELKIKQSKTDQQKTRKCGFDC